MRLTGLLLNFGLTLFVSNQVYNCNIHAIEVIMSTPIVECIANYSQARRPEVVAKIRDAIVKASLNVGLHQVLQRDFKDT